MDTTQRDQPERIQSTRLPTLRVLFSGSAGICTAAPHLLAEGDTPIGRSSGARRAIALPEDPRVSRQHASVAARRRTANTEGFGPERWRVEMADSGSANGTFVNGVRVSRAALADGDIVRVGDSFLIFRMEPVDPADVPIAGLLGVSAAMRALRGDIRLVGASTATVLLLGETGTGKEVVARALHQVSRRRGAFVAVNCAAIPESLAESQLFGHAAGAFTGAQSAHEGFFRAAHGGTLFLDELGELSPAVQPKLLRAIEDREVVPVGATRPVPCDVRLIGATHRDLVGESSDAPFRADLLARLNEVTFLLPPLRERREDILCILRATLPAPAPVLTPRLVEALLLHAWPHNVRELLKVTSELAIRAAGRPQWDLPAVAHRLSGDGEVPLSFGQGPARPSAEVAAGPLLDEAPKPSRQRVPARDELLDLLVRCHGNISEVSRLSGRSRRQVQRWIQQHAIDLAALRGQKPEP